MTRDPNLAWTLVLIETTRREAQATKLLARETREVIRQSRAVLSQVLPVVTIPSAQARSPA